MNQKLGLLFALLEHGDWPMALQLLDLLPPYMAMWSAPIVQSLCGLVHTCIVPLYKRYALMLGVHMHASDWLRLC